MSVVLQIAFEVQKPSLAMKARRPVRLCRQIRFVEIVCASFVVFVVSARTTALNAMYHNV
jgi:hypothetical protein